MTHLGGSAFYDYRSATPGLWAFLVETFKPVTAIDIGCGTGYCVSVLNQMGVQAIGVDGDPGLFGLGLCHSSRFALHDYTLGPFPVRSDFDMVLSTEFVEHVEEEYADNFLQDFARARKVLAMTFAKPGSVGWHHVNLQDEGYWVEKVEAATGLKLDRALTEHCRTLDPESYKFFHETGLVFTR